MHPPEAMRSGGLRPVAYLRAKLLQTDGGLCHPAPALLLAPNASGRAPSLRGHYPASSLLRARPSGSRLRRTSPLGSRDDPAPPAFSAPPRRLSPRATPLLRWLSPRGEEPFPVSTHGLTRVPPPSTPPDD